MYEDNVACIAHIQGDFIMGDRIKHILPKFSIHMNFKRTVKLKSNKFDQVKPSWSLYKGITQVNFSRIGVRNWHALSQLSEQLKFSLIEGEWPQKVASWSMQHLIFRRVVLFFLRLEFFPTGFSLIKVLTRQHYAHPP